MQGLGGPTVSATGRAGEAFRLVMFGGLLLSLAANVPGHMSFDSVVSLVEARTGVRQTWAPAVSSWVLKPFDHLVAGTGLYVVASTAFLFLSLMSLSRLRPWVSWAAVALGVVVVLTPQVLIYQGIVWRDVLFANLAIAGFVLLARAVALPAPRPSLLPLAGAVACLALAVLARQNGLIMAAAAAGVLAWIVRTGGWRVSLAWGGGLLAAIAILSVGLDRLSQPPEIPERLKANLGFQILEHYDVVGARAHKPDLKLKEIGKTHPAAEAIIEGAAAKVYDPSRVDTLDDDVNLRQALWRSSDAMDAQWRHIVIHAPAAYLRHRADVFRWTFLTPDLSRCLPVNVGVLGPDSMLKDLDLQAGAGPRQARLSHYAALFYGTPVFSHAAWALVALGVMGLLLRRRDPADWVFVALLGGSLAFTASFFVISVACDYRYLYLLDLSAMVGVLYWALDPPRWRKAA